MLVLACVLNRCMFIATLAVIGFLDFCALGKAVFLHKRSVVHFRTRSLGVILLVKVKAL